MLCFGRGFVPSTFLLLLLFLSTAIHIDAVWMCINEQYNPNVFSRISPIYSSIICKIPQCAAYACKVNATFYFGEDCWDNILNLCKSSDGSNAMGKLVTFKFSKRVSWKPSNLYKEYMEEIKSFGNDSMQERFFWLKAFKGFGYDVTNEHLHFWSEKAIAYFPMILQNFTDEIQNSQIYVEKKVKAVMQMRGESIFYDVQDVQNAANQGLPETKYLQKKNAEMEAKMEAIKMQVDDILKSYIIRSNVTLLNVETGMYRAQMETSASINAFSNMSGFTACQNVQADILQKVGSIKDIVLHLLKFANETIDHISGVVDDEISYIQSAGYEARKAMENYESEKELKDLIKEIRDAVKDVKKIGEAAQKSADKAQAIAENAEKTAENAKGAADSAGKDAEALHSNGRKNGRFEVAFIVFFMVLNMIN